MKTARANEADWEYTYAPCGKKTSVHNTRANEMETREYDGLGRLKSIEHKNANDFIIIFRIEYRLGPDGNRVGAFERRQTVNDDIATSWSYTYDPLGRLLRERRSINNHYGTDPNTFTQDRDTSYEYDRDSNRTMVTDHQPSSVSIEKYAYVQDTQKLHQVITGSGYKQYSWTANGEMAREDNYTGGSFDETETYYVGGTLKSSQIYTWGIGGVLSEVRFEGGDQDGCKVNYEYDSDSELIGRKVTLKNGTVTENERYLVDHQNPTGYSQRLAVLDSLTGSIRHEIFTDELAAETTVNSGSSNTQFPHADGVGSIRALTGKSAAEENLGTSAERHFYDYTAFGSSLRGDSSLTNYAFTGQILDQKTSTQYHRARSYNPELGAWLTIDPVFDFPANMGSPFGYVLSGLLNNVDPSGCFALVEAVITAVINLFNATVRFITSAWAVAAARIASVYASINAFLTNIVMYLAMCVKFNWNLFINWLQNMGQRITASNLWAIVTRFLDRLRGLGTRPDPPSLQEARQVGFNTIGKLKTWWSNNVFKLPGSDYDLHHFVGEFPANISRFGAEAIHSRANSMPVLSEAYHRLISGFYSSGPNTLAFMNRYPSIFGNHGKFRDWIATQTWEVQWQWGFAIVQHVMRFGTIDNFDPRRYYLL